MMTTLSKRWRTRLVAAMACVAVSSAATAEPDPMQQGRAALDSRCSRCHAIGLDGTSPHATAPPFRDVVKRYPPENLEEALAEGIDTGHPDMPTFILSPKEIEAVVVYLRSLLAP
jgi:mono/diheme cytochrome c family protein